jgi:predicted PurR-regulated permease PerM
MLALPSIWNILISSIVFFIAVWYLRRYLDEQGLPKGITRSLLVFMLASLASCGTGTFIDKIAGKKADPAAPTALKQLLNAAKQSAQE